jgi:hypothetical protein
LKQKMLPVVWTASFVSIVLYSEPSYHMGTLGRFKHMAPMLIYICCVHHIFFMFKR